MRNFKLFLLALLSLSLIVACSDDDNTEGKFGTKEEVNIAISKKWSISGEQNDYKCIEFIATNSTTHDGTYTIIKKDGSPIAGNYTINPNAEV